MKVASLYSTLIILGVGGFQWLVKASIRSNQVSELDISVRNAEIDQWTIYYVLIISIFFLAILFYADKDAVRKDVNVLDNKKTFMQVYIPFYKIIFNRIEIGNYRDWAYSFAVAGDTKIRQDLFYNLQDLVGHCSQVQQREGYEIHFSLIANFRSLLIDLLSVFDCHSASFGNSHYWFHKFYKDHAYNSQTHEEERIYREEILLIGDLTFEMTRLLNYILDEIRKYDVGFLSEYGNLSIIDATDANGNRDTPIIYTDDQKSEAPYPGLETFIKERGNRMHHYSTNDIMIEDLKKNSVL